MPLSKEKFDAALDFNELKQKYAAKLELIASRLGLVQEKEVPTNGGIVDFVWYCVLKESVPQIGNRLPVVGFEVETSWRTRKHIKGDLFNLLELSPALGVILFLHEGFKEDEAKLNGNVDAAKRYAAGFSGISRIVVWTSKDVADICNCALFDE